MKKYLGRNLAIGIFSVIIIFLIIKFVFGTAIDDIIVQTYTAQLRVHRSWLCYTTNIESIQWFKGRKFMILGIPGTGGTYSVQGTWDGPAGSTSFDSKTITLACGDTKVVNLYLKAHDGAGSYSYEFTVLTETGDVKDQKTGSYVVS
ncbi:MAG: hypothetical protein ACE5KD_00570 [Candidatus Bathyarchaeia archaeon]